MACLCMHVKARARIRSSGGKQTRGQRRKFRPVAQACDAHTKACARGRRSRHRSGMHRAPFEGSLAEAAKESTGQAYAPNVAFFRVFFNYLGACRRRTPRTCVDLKVHKDASLPRPFHRCPPIRSSPRRSPSAGAEKWVKMDPRWNMAPAMAIWSMAPSEYREKDLRPMRNSGSDGV